MSLSDLADFALITESREPPGIPRSANGAWTSRSPILLLPSPVPGSENVPVPSHYYSPLFPRHSFGFCASKSGDVYFYGGEVDVEGRADELYHYSTKDNTATPLQCWGESPGPRSWHAMAILGDVIALHGGTHGGDRWANSDLYLLNLVSREWTRINTTGEAPGKCRNHSMAVIGTTLYVFGGTGPHLLGKSGKLNTLWAFRLSTLRTQPSWELVKPYERPSPRRFCSMIPYKHHLILFGGQGSKYQLLGDVWAFNVERRTWSELQCTGDVPPPMYGHTVVALDDIIYVTGGSLQGSIRIFALHVAEQRWVKPSIRGPAPINRDRHASACIGTKIFIFGGRFRQDVSEKDSIHVLDSSCIPYTHTPERLREIENESLVIENQQKLEREVLEQKDGSQVQNVEVRGVPNEHSRSEGRVELSTETLEEGASMQTGTSSRSPGGTVEEILAKNSKLEKRVEELEFEIESLRGAEIISSMLEPQFNVDSLAHIRGPNAQIMVDFLAQSLERQDLQSNANRRRVLHLLIKLAKSAQVFPKRVELSNVLCDLSTPINDGGGHGFIYKGSFQDHAVCVKAVRVLESASRASRTLRAQAGELVLLAHVSHPNIIPLYGAYFSTETLPRICIVSPWMEHGDLLTFLMNSPDTPPIPLVGDLASGLAFLHDMGIVHADLKARNVLICQSRRAVLADFGVSAVLNTNVGTTTSQDFSGTTFWMAPEQLVPNQAEELSPPSTHTDMWGFACICYEVLTGDIPFAQHYTHPQLISALMKGHATPLRPKPSSDPTIVDGGPLVTLAEKCWNYNPSQRPTAAEAVQFLVDLSVQDDRPPLDVELAMFEAVKNSRAKVKIDYARVFSLIRSYAYDKMVHSESMGEYSIDPELMPNNNGGLT